ncbi:MAG: squalene--hopene cyclase [Candidatus Hydrogenedentes bacterium]|nr:squalene--hopene cyclase [Candidatus Hydrogenedentota bacterium]
MSEAMNAIRQTLENARARLLGERNSSGHWVGELSSSALSTATALCALTLARREAGEGSEAARLDARIAAARRWLADHQNADGGWGDTAQSPTNISTTTLCWAALSVSAHVDGEQQALARATAWLQHEIGELTPNAISQTICSRYGVDRTFSVPILTLCALAGRFGDGPEAWKDIPALPFELGAFPRRWFNRLGLPVVSYALPALIAVGNVQHHKGPSRNPLLRLIRARARNRTLQILEEIQPESGGFLEAAPLTSFVVMSLIGAGLADHPVTRKGLAFLEATVREDGSWPIDTNLATWVTTLSIKALYRNPALGSGLSGDARVQLRTWLLALQGRTRHPYTLAEPGGWAWTDLSGGVPDADDTPGALLALYHLAEKSSEGHLTDILLVERASAGLQWLVDLQNKDGGIPTFCRGWGKLPFDKSCPDLTAHSLRAWFAWRGEVREHLRARIDRAAARAIAFLLSEQAEDGSWTPLWFGNQSAPGQANPVYGTAMTLGVHELPDATVFKALHERWGRGRARAVAWLLKAQSEDGGWGGAPGVAPTIEETALAVDALARSAAGATEVAALRRGCDWLVNATAGGTEFPATPIGLYFAQLWYHERLYPLVFTISALAGALHRLEAEAMDSEAS